MRNPFEGLSKQEVGRQAIEDSVESNERGVLFEQDYFDIENFLYNSKDFKQIVDIFKKVGLSNDAWEYDERLQEIRDRVFIDYLDDGTHIVELDNFLNLVGLNPDWNDYKVNIQYRYQNYIENHTPQYIDVDVEYFGIKPDLEDENMKRAIDNALYDLLHEGSYRAISSMSKDLGVKFDWQGELKTVVTREYENCIFNNNERVERISEFQELSGIAPDWQGELKSTVMQKYMDDISNGYWDRISELQELSGIAPDWKGELKPEVMKEYSVLVCEEPYLWKDKILKLQEISGIAPDWESELVRPMIIKKFSNIIDDSGYRFVERVSELQEFFGIVPDWERELRDGVISLYREVFTNRYFDSSLLERLETINKVTGIEPNWEKECADEIIIYLKKQLNGYLGGEEFKSTADVLDRIKFRPEGIDKLDDIVGEKFKELLRGSDYKRMEALFSVWRIEHFLEVKSVVDDIQATYLRLLRHDAENDQFDLLTKATGVKPDWEKYREEILFELKEDFSNKHWKTLNRKQELTGIRLEYDAEEKVKIAGRIKMLFTSERFNVYDKIKSIQDATGVKLDWGSEELRKGVMGMLGNIMVGGRYEDFVKLSDLAGLDLDNVKYFSRQISARYQLELQALNIENVAKIAKITGVSLKEIIEQNDGDMWGGVDATVGSCYSKLIEKGDFASIRKLEEMSNVVFRGNDQLSSIYARYVDRAIVGDEGGVKELWDFTGIEPDFEGTMRSVVVDGYRDALKNHQLGKIEQLMKSSGVKIDWESELGGVIQEYYQFCVGATYSKDKILFLKTLTGVAPDWEGELKPLVLKKYAQYVTNGFFENLVELQELSGIAPDWGGELKPVVMKRYTGYVSDGMLDNISKLQEISGVVPDWEGELKPVVMQRYTGYVSRSDSDRIAGFEKISGILLADLVKDPYFWELCLKRVNIKLIDNILQNDAYGGEVVVRVFETELQVHYQELIVKAVKGEGNDFNFVKYCITKYKQKPTVEVLSAVAVDALANDEDFDRFLNLVSLCGYRSLGKIKVDDVKNRSLNLRQIANIQLLKLLPDEVDAREELMGVLENKTPMARLALKLLSARDVPSPAKRLEYCPWKQDLEPLVGHFERLGNKEMKEEVGLEAMVNYVQRFGMKNLPLLAETSINLYLLRDKILKSKNEGVDISSCVKSFLESASGLRLKRFLELHGVDIDLDSISRVQDIDKIFKALEKVVSRLKRDILEDKMPDVLEQSPLDMELFNSVMVRSGRWANNDHGSSREELIGSWRRVKESGDGDLPKYFQRETYQLEIQTEGAITDMLDKLKGVGGGEEEKVEMRDGLKKERALVLSRDEYRAYLAPFVLAFQESGRLKESVANPEMVFSSVIISLTRKIDKQKELLNNLEDIPKNEKRKLGMQKGIESLESKLEMLRELSTREGIDNILMTSERSLDSQIKEIEDGKEGSQAELIDLDGEYQSLKEKIEKEGLTPGLKKDEKRLSKLIQRVKSKINRSSKLLLADLDKVKRIREKYNNSDNTESEQEYISIQAMLTALSYHLDKKDGVAITGDARRLMAVRLVELEARGHVDAIREAEAGNDENAKYKAWRTLFEEQLLQHFIDPNYEDQPRLVAFPSEVVELLESVWRLSNIRQKSIEVLSGKTKEVVKHPFLRVVRDLSAIDSELLALERGDTEVKKETVAVTYNPCHGLGRVFSGDVGDACYTSHRSRFAENEYPNLHAIILSKEDEKSKEVKLLGSVLLIEGKDVKGKKYLFARAVNPIDSVIKREISAEEFLRGLLEYLKTTAERAGFDEAVLCVDTVATASGSNRKEMFDAMGKAARDNNWPIADRLESTVETNFKYDVHNTERRKVYRVWQRDEK